VIVEGVENEQQLDLIRKLGGNEIQGYLLGRPIPDPTSQILELSRRAAGDGESASHLLTNQVEQKT